MSIHTMADELRSRGPLSVVALSGFGIAVVALAAEMFSGLGSRWGWWHFTTGFAILKGAAVVGLLAALIDAVDSFLVRRAGSRFLLSLAVSGMAIGLIASAIPAAWYRTALRMPAIHDITTDMQDPPAFSAILPLRQNAANPAQYGGPEIASMQSKAYPDVRPLVLPLDTKTAFMRALMEAKSMGWDIVDADARAGRIEATATTFWFGFKDDIVVRVRPDGEGSRIDVRSVSRVGRNDMGTNAKRIMRYLRALGMEA